MVSPKPQLAPCPQNAMRATVESHENSPRLPAIKVMVALGQEDLSIKVRKGPPAPAWYGGDLIRGGCLGLGLSHPPILQMSDRGMGVPLRKIERLFSYMYSTAPTPQLGTGGAPLVGAPLVGGTGTPHGIGG